MENKEKKMLTTEDLNRTLGKRELYSIAFGHVIGSGVFSLIGIGIGYTGKSAWIGILLSAVFILLQALPFIVMAGTARFRGGYYSISPGRAAAGAHCPRGGGLPDCILHYQPAGH